MADLAELNLVIKSQGAKQATNDLQALSATAKRVEDSVQLLIDYVDTINQRFRNMSDQLRAAEASFNNFGGSVRRSIVALRGDVRAGTEQLNGLAATAIRIEGAINGMGEAFNNAQVRMRSFNKETKETSSSFSVLGVNISTIIGAIGGLLGGLSAVRLALKAVSTAADFRQTEIGFETLLGSAAKARDLLKFITDYSRETPFEIQGLFDASRQVLLFTKDTTEAKRVLKILLDTAAATGQGAEGLRSIGLALQQIKSLGRVAAQELNQLGNAGVPAREILGKSLGLSGPELFKALESNTIPVEKALEALLSGLEDRFGGAAQRLGDETKGLFIRLKNDITLVFKDLGDTIIDSLNINSALKYLQDNIQGFGFVLKSVFQILTGSNNPLDQLPRSFYILAGAIKIAVDALIALTIVRSTQFFLNNIEGGRTFAFTLRALRVASLELSEAFVIEGAAARAAAVGTAALSATGTVLAGVFKTLYAALGPAGWAILGITLLIEAVRYLNQGMTDAEIRASRAAQAVRDLEQAHKSGADAALNYKRAIENKDLDDQTKALRQYIDSYKDLEKQLIQLRDSKGQPFEESDLIKNVGEKFYVRGSGKLALGSVISETQTRGEAETIAANRRGSSVEKVGFRPGIDTEALRGLLGPGGSGVLNRNLARDKGLGLDVSTITPERALKVIREAADETGRSMTELEDKIKGAVNGDEVKPYKETALGKFFDGLTKDAQTAQFISEIPKINPNTGQEFTLKELKEEVKLREEIFKAREKAFAAGEQFDEKAFAAGTNNDLYGEVAKSIRDVITHTNELNKVTDDHIDALEAEAKAQKEANKAREKAIEDIDKLLDKTKASIAALREEGDASVATKAYFEAMAIAREGNIDIISNGILLGVVAAKLEEDRLQRMKKADTAADKLGDKEAAARMKIVDSIKEQIDAMKLELSLVNETNDTRERSLALAKSERELRKLSAADIQQIINYTKGTDPLADFPGQLEPGNIDLKNRPRHVNPDGTISTVRSQSFSYDNKEVLLPTVADNGDNLNSEEAQALYEQTGKHLGIFKTIEAADAYAAALHEEQAKIIDADLDDNIEKEKRILELKKLQGDLIKQRQDAVEFKKFADDIGQTFDGLTQDLIFNAKSIEDAFRDMVLNISKLLYEQFVGKNITEFIAKQSVNLFSAFGLAPAGTAVASAKGNIFMNGNVMPFASGGIINDTTIFPLRNGRVGVAGEAGSEVYARPKRMANGDMGFALQGGGGNQNNVTMNVYTQDADSFKRSSKQIQRKLRRSIT